VAAQAAARRGDASERGWNRFTQRHQVNQHPREENAGHVRAECTLRKSTFHSHFLDGGAEIDHNLRIVANIYKRITKPIYNILEPYIFGVEQ
jgi:cytochrome oxidase assembly protein ShyY1